MYESFFFSFSFLAWMRKSKERKRERKREKIYHIITMMMFFYEKYTTGKAQDSERKCADGASLIFFY